MKFVKGMGAGLLAGMCIGLAAAPGGSKNSCPVSSAVKSMGRAMESFGDSLRF